MSRRLHTLAELGQSPWIDFLSRDLLKGGELARMMREDAIAGVTSNPTIFQKAISAGNAYDEQLRELVADESDPRELFFRLAVQDVREACDLLLPVWESGARGRDGNVSLEVDPGLAYDTQGTIDQAQRLAELVDRQNLYVKIPATKEGLPAIEEMIARGRPINVTLIFSLERYAEVVEAYIRGVERLVESGGDPAKVTSVASFFVSRVDTEADRRLDEVGPPRAEGQARDRERQARLPALQRGLHRRALGAPGRQGRDPAVLPLGIHVHEEPRLPRRALRRGADRARHGGHDAGGDDRGVPGSRTRRADARARARRGARSVFEQIAEAGVDYDDVTDTLEREGVEKFSDSFDELLAGIEASARDLVTA